MEGFLDPFDFYLASELGLTIYELHSRMGNDEYLKWRAFFVYRNAQHDLAVKAAEARIK
jgi:hypothetical protein